MANIPSVSQIAGNQLQTYEGFFRLADPGNSGQVAASHAASFLKQSGLSDQVLSKIWEISDYHIRGFLDRQGFFIALKLIALVQAGKEAAIGNLSMTTPLPKLGSLQPPVLPQRRPSQSESLPVLQDPSKQQGLMPGERDRYEQLFQSLGPENNKLPASKAKTILLNSNLPTDTLGKIWDLSDIDKDGFLDLDEFCLAMHFVYCCREKVPLPTTLPAHLIPQSKVSIAGPASVASSTSMAGSVSPRPVATVTKPTSALLPGAVAVLPPLPSQGMAPALVSPRSPALSSNASPSHPVAARRSSATPPVLQPPPRTMSISSDSAAPVTHITPHASPAHMPSSPALSQWTVPAGDRQRFEANFHLLDTDKDGLVSGTDCKDIFIRTGLPQPLLAHIWGLCDTQNTGHLSLEQFVLAMHFVNQKVTANVDPPTSALDISPRPTGSPVTGGETEFSKETEGIVKEIEEIKRQKIELEGEKQQKEADLKIRMGEVTTLQKELDSVLSTNEQLERQRLEAQKRLDELDDQDAFRKVDFDYVLKSAEVSKSQGCKSFHLVSSYGADKRSLTAYYIITNSRLQSESRDLREQWDEKQLSLNQTQEEITQLSRSVWEQEGELVSLREELERLSEEERTTEEKINTNTQLMSRTTSSMNSTTGECTKLADQLKAFEADRVRLQKAVSQYEALLKGDEGAEEPPDHLTAPPNSSSLANKVNGFDNLFAKPDPFAVDPFKKDVDPFKKDVDPFKKDDDPFKSDPFAKSSDPFTKSSDPFGGEDPFKGLNMEAEKQDPFAGSDPFKNEQPSKSDSKDLFTSNAGSLFSADAFGDKDTFGSHSSENRSQSVMSGDPFDPFGGGGVANSSSNSGFGSSSSVSRPSASTSGDPFGSSTFETSFPSQAPDKKQPPPRPAPPRPNAAPRVPPKESTTSKGDNSNLLGGFNDSLFGDKDPFSSNTGGKADDKMFGKDAFGGSNASAFSSGGDLSKTDGGALFDKPNSDKNAIPFGNSDPFADLGKKLGAFDAFADFEKPSSAADNAFKGIDPFAPSGQKQDTSTANFDLFAEVSKGKSGDFDQDSQRNLLSNQKNQTKTVNTKDAFANFGKFPESAPADPLAWAKADSARLEEERKRKLLEQEKADLEFAIRLSKEESTA